MNICIVMLTCTVVLGFVWFALEFILKLYPLSFLQTTPQYPVCWRVAQ